MSKPDFPVPDEAVYHVNDIKHVCEIKGSNRLSTVQQRTVQKLCSMHETHGCFEEIKKYGTSRIKAKIRNDFEPVRLPAGVRLHRVNSDGTVIFSWG